MTKKVTYILLFLLISSINIYSQREAYNWHFGYGCAITFNTPDREPEMLTGSAIWQLEGVSGISTGAGELLFYSDGKEVYNKSNTWMNYKVFLKSTFSATMSSVIFPKPGSKNLYYIVTCDAAQYIEPPNDGINYSVIDMNLRNGMGDFVEINKPLWVPNAEKLIAIRHLNGNDVWAVGHEWMSKRFVSFKFSDKGVSDTVFSDVGSFHGDINDQWDSTSIGYMKASPQGDKIAVVKYGVPMVEVFRFNRQTGELYSYLNLYLPNKLYLYGVEFSPNGKLLYVNDQKTTEIFRFDLTEAKPDENVYTYATGIKGLGAMQIAPNGKIYVSSYAKSYLHSINNPNSTGALNFVINSVRVTNDLKNFIPTYGLPNFLNDFFAQKLIANAKGVCRDETVTLTADFRIFSPGTDFEWTGPAFANPVKGDSVQFVLNDNTIGWYKVRAMFENFWYSDSIYINYNEAPIAEIEGNSVICDNGFTFLRSRFQKAGYKYLWSNGKTEAEIKVVGAGIYTLKVFSEAGCVDSASVNVEIKPPMDIEILGKLDLCLGDTVTIRSNIDHPKYKYIWNTGETSSSIVVSTAGVYWVSVTDIEGCTGTDTVEIDVLEKPEISMNEYNRAFCKGDSTFVEVLNPDNSYLYWWSDDSKETSRYLNKTETLILYAANLNGCIDSVVINVESVEIPNAKIKIIGAKVLCANEKAVLRAENYNTEFQYEWSNGSTSSEIEITEPGMYYLYVENFLGCGTVDSILIEKSKPFQTAIISQTDTLCSGIPITLSLSDNYFKYLWSTGETSANIKVDKAGLYKVEVWDTLGCSGNAEIEIYEYDIKLEYDNELFMESVCLGELSEKSFSIKNTGNSKINISEFEIIGINNFMKINNLIGEINASSSKEVKVSFIPDSLFDGNYLVNFKIDYPCEKWMQFKVSANSFIYVELSLPEIYAEVGVDTCIPIYAKLICKNAKDITAKIKGKISYQADYFLVNSAKNLKFNNEAVVNGLRYVSFESDSIKISQNKSLIGELCGITLVGSTEKIPLDFADLNSLTNNLFFDSLPGSLTLENCMLPLRGIKLFEPTKIFIAPHPADESSKITIQTSETGNFELLIFNQFGEQINSFKFTKSNSNSEIIAISPNLQSNGLYILKLISEKSTQFEKMIFMK